MSIFNNNLFILSIFPLVLFFSILLIGLIQLQAFTETAELWWSNGTAMPTPRTEIAATNIGNNIYVIGGYTNNNWHPSAKLFIYDPEKDIWTEGSPMSTARGALTAVFIDEILYAIGGEGEHGIMDINEAYNSKNNNWISKSPMHTARHHAASAVVDGNVYVIGGRVQGVSPITNVNVNEMYDSKMDLWITLNFMPSEEAELVQHQSIMLQFTYLEEKI
jgi:N-acetylneuraminic acid mutarotase